MQNVSLALSEVVRTKAEIPLVKIKGLLDVFDKLNRIKFITDFACKRQTGVTSFTQLFKRLKNRKV